MTPRAAGIPRPVLPLLGPVVLACALAPAALQADAAAQSCADCCKLPCIEAEILKAKDQRASYLKMSTQRNWTQATYDAAENAAASAAEAKRIAALPGLETCNYYIPENQSYAESREFQMAGFKILRDANGRVVGGDYTAKTNLKTCGVNQKALDLLPKVSPCEGIGRATAAHEQKHVEDCEQRDPARREIPLDQVAKGEVAGYDVEIAELENVRREAASSCFKKSCESTPTDWEKAAEKLKLDIFKLTGTKRKKPPSNSPLARNPGGR